jgi:hypothetical protein
MQSGINLGAQMRAPQSNQDLLVGHRTPRTVSNESVRLFAEHNRRAGCLRSLALSQTHTHPPIPLVKERRVCAGRVYIFAGVTNLCLCVSAPRCSPKLSERVAIMLPRVIILDTSFFYKADRKSYTALPFADKRRDFMSALRPGCKRSSLIFNTPATHVVCSRWALSFS